jgi:hypothetical protein
MVVSRNSVTADFRAAGGHSAAAALGELPDARGRSAPRFQRPAAKFLPTSPHRAGAHFERRPFVVIFYVGRKVVYVNGHFRRDGLLPWYHATALPQVGGVYKIRHIFDARPFGYDEPGILLVEVVNPVLEYVAPGGDYTGEQFFLASRFRPLHDTNIEVFTQMLEPVPQEPAELVDA